ncbi:MAG: glycosyltransferase family 4 protein [Phycisphaerales bacterium]|nr:glycosyltransferase family 4 protein [Phycisphaerales bacterium]
MLGWEYPPHIAGGLGVACEGIVRALVDRGHRIHFVVPALYGDETARDFVLSDARLLAPVPGGEGSLQTSRYAAHLLPYGEAAATDVHAMPWASTAEGRSSGSPAVQYSRNLLMEVASYAERVSAGLAGESFDLIHAHDWMTMPAGMAIKRRTGRPLVVHVHSLEFDRAGEHGNAAIVDVERRGLTEADLVIAVSDYTKSIVCGQYGVSAEKVCVVHNGIYPLEATDYQADPLFGNRPVVLFLGRVTYQKGPDYFVRAADIVRRFLPDTLFVVAGAGDLLASTIEMVHALGLERHVLFTGFLKGADVERAYAASSLYVMPSVSEPFGLTALEAVRAGVPCILSKQSGVSEVVRHSLRVDFWDVERLADLMINALRSPELRRQLVEMSMKEVSRMRWDASAALLEEAYGRFAA